MLYKDLRNLFPAALGYKFKLTDYDKLILFKQQLSGSALVLVDSLSLDKQTFKDAVDLLSEALASPDTQKHNVLKQLSEICSFFKDNPLEYISKMRMIQDTIKKLKIDANSCQNIIVTEQSSDLQRH